MKVDAKGVGDRKIRANARLPQDSRAGRIEPDPFRARDTFARSARLDAKRLGASPQKVVEKFCLPERKDPLPVLLFPHVVDALAARHGSASAAMAHVNRFLLPEQPASGTALPYERVVLLSDIHPGGGTNQESGHFAASEDLPPQRERDLVRLYANEWKAAIKQNSAVPVALRQKLFDMIEDGRWQHDGQALDMDLIRAYRECVKASGATSAGVDKHRAAYQLTVTHAGDGGFADFLRMNEEHPALDYPSGRSRNGALENTPANNLVQLAVTRRGHPALYRTYAMHLLLGFKKDVIPGNHDRNLDDPQVWDGRLRVWERLHRESAPQAKGFWKRLISAVTPNDVRLVPAPQRSFVVHGVLGILRADMRDLGATEAEVSDAISRISKAPFRKYADVWVEHGQAGDSLNQVRKPNELPLRPVGWHGRLQNSFGDNGTSAGFNPMQAIDPKLAGTAGWRMGLRIILNPRLWWSAAKMVAVFLKSINQGEADVSSAADRAQRERDSRSRLVLEPKLLENLNQHPLSGHPLSIDDSAAMFNAMDAAGPAPLYSQFHPGQRWLDRTTELWKLSRAGDSQQYSIYRALVAQKYLGINALIDGHTHFAQNERFLAPDSRVLHHMNLGTSIQLVGGVGGAQREWGYNSFGVGVVEFGKSTSGALWRWAGLHRFDHGNLVEGEQREDSVRRQKNKDMALVSAIYDASAPSTP
jgi:hypothetical protein